jgi:hypothetical protein
VSAVVVVAVILGIFFVGGLMVGVVVMIALAARRPARKRRTGPAAPGDEPQYRPETGPNDDRLDEPGWWRDHNGR